VPRSLKRTKFKELDINDPFFDSLKSGYQEFPQWFASKANDELYVVTDGKTLSGMIYLKEETGPVTDVTPKLTSTLVSMGRNRQSPACPTSSGWAASAGPSPRGRPRAAR